MRRRLETLALAAALSAAPACSVIFDPSQYRTTDAAMGEIDADLPSDVDADRREPDAFVLPPDAWAPDAWAPDAAAPACPTVELGALDLPTCSGSSRLVYCSPEDGSARSLSRSVAEALLPGGRGYRLGLLGNAIEIADAPEGQIVDHEIVRQGDDLAVVWLESPVALSRARYVVVDGGLDRFGSTESYDVSALAGATPTDLSVRPGDVDGVVLAFRDAAGGAVIPCASSSAGCVSAQRLPAAVGEPVWVAHANDAVIGAFHESAPDRLQLEQVLPTRSRSASQNLDAPGAVSGLRSTSGDLVYTDGPSSSLHFGFRPNGAGLDTVSIGAELPRITNVLGGFLQGQLNSLGDPGVVTAFIDCSGGSCTCTGCRGPGFEEASVAGVVGVRDWTFHNVDQYFRVAVFLYGDGAGTNVGAAMWSAEGSPMDSQVLEPLVFGSGRVSGSPPGVGRSIRAVVTRSADAHRLEVFAATLVALGGRDRIYLSGFRLEWCTT
jgi:hypothetical protein